MQEVRNWLYRMKWKSFQHSFHNFIICSLKCPTNDKSGDTFRVNIDIGRGHLRSNSRSIRVKTKNLPLLEGEKQLFSIGHTTKVNSFWPFNPFSPPRLGNTNRCIPWSRPCMSRWVGTAIRFGGRRGIIGYEWFWFDIFAGRRNGSRVNWSRDWVVLMLRYSRKHELLFENVLRFRWSKIGQS